MNLSIGFGAGFAGRATVRGLIGEIHSEGSVGQVSVQRAPSAIQFSKLAICESVNFAPSAGISPALIRLKSRLSSLERA